MTANVLTDYVNEIPKPLKFSDMDYYIDREITFYLIPHK